MKKATILVLCMMLLPVFGARAEADHDRPIPFNEMPAVSKDFISRYFPEETPALVKMERDFPELSYEVIFTGGIKLEFDRRGEWTKVSCRYSAMPEGIVPAPMEAKARDLYPGAAIVEAERDRRELEIKLNNGMELTFSTDGRLINIDD